MFSFITALGAADEIVHQDPNGRLIEYIAVPNLHGTPVAHSLTVDGSGNVVMFEGVRSNRRVVELDARQNVVVDTAPPRHVENLAIADGRIFGLSNSEVLNAVDGTSIEQVNRDTGTPFILLPDRGSKLLAINQVDGSFYSVDTAARNSEASTVHFVTGSEVRSAIDNNAAATKISSAGGIRLTIAEAASDGAGNIYVTLPRS